MITRVSLSTFIKDYSIKELAVLYDVSYKTMTAWLAPHREQIGSQFARKFTPKQTALIFELLGIPKKVAEVIDEEA